jgi:hypothetical protein
MGELSQKGGEIQLAKNPSKARQNHMHLAVGSYLTQGFRTHT